MSLIQRQLVKKGVAARPVQRRPAFPTRNHLLHLRTKEGFCHGIKCFDLCLWLKCLKAAWSISGRSRLSTEANRC